MTPFEESLAETLQHISNSKYLISIEEEILREKINKFISNTNPTNKINIEKSISQLMIYYQQIQEKIENVSQKMSIYFPTLDSLASLSFKEANLPEGLVEIESLIDEIISSIRRVIYKEYRVELLDLIKLEITPGSTFIIEPYKLLIIFNRIFDDIFLTHQIKEKEYPLIEIIISNVESNFLVIYFKIKPAYDPNNFTLYFCEQLIDYYSGKIKLESSQKETNWTIKIPMC